MQNPIVLEDMAVIADAPLPFEKLAGKTILVTGAAGFLPAYLVRALLHLNSERQLELRVIGLVRNEATARERFASELGHSDFTLVVSNLDAPLKIDGRVDYVVHAASQASPKYFGEDPVGTLLPNVFGTRHLLELASSKASAGFLFFSSGEVYGEVSPEQIPTPETAYGRVDPTEVRSCYAESKRMGEALCVAWTRQYGLHTSIVRPFHTYGPGMKLDDGRVFSDFVRNVLLEEDIVMKSDGKAIRSYCYLADATIGFLTVLLKGLAGEAYNVGNPNAAVSVMELAQTLANLYPAKGIGVVKQARGPDDGPYLQSPISKNCPDIAKIGALEWAPRVDLETGFRRTIESFAVDQLQG